MIKAYRFIREFHTVLNEVAEEIAGGILAEYPNGEIEGFEEDITPQLKGDINRRLLDEIKKKLNGKEIKGVKFTVYTFKKSAEKDIGADLSGVIELDFTDGRGDRRQMAKAFLSQAKVCSITDFPDFPDREPRIRGNDSRIITQADNMLKITSDSFFFCYTTKGIFVVPALHVSMRGKNSIDTAELYFKKLGTFYEEFFKCFIGDHKIAPIYNKPADLKRHANIVGASSVLYIRASN